MSLSGSDLSCVIVFMNFEGDEYTTARARRKSIIGIPCLQQLVREKRQKLPDLDISPVYSLLMENCVVCTTNISSDEKDEITRYTNLMGGRFYGEFTHKVTHLITDRAQPKSLKYVVALSENPVPIVKPAWIRRMWHDQKKYPCEDFLVQTFCGMKLSCAPSLPSDVKKKLIDAVVEKGGGSWVSLEDDEVPHYVIVDLTAKRTEAVRRATLKGSLEVTSAWVDECLRVGGVLDVKTMQTVSPQPKFVALLTSDCPAECGNLVKKCGGITTTKLSDATVVVSPHLLPPDSPYSRSGKKIAHPNWLLESSVAKMVLPMDLFTPKSSAPVTPQSTGGFVPGTAARQQTTPVPLVEVLVFSGHTFALVGFTAFEEDTVRTLILEKGGRISGLATAEVIVHADGVVVDESISDRVVSMSWLRVSAKYPSEMVPRDHFTASPFPFDCPSSLMSNVCVSVTGFRDLERALLEDVCGRIGARFSSPLTREVTHLICLKPEGPKYDTVMRKGWSTHVVSVSWLIECCKMGVPVDALDHTLVALSSESHDAVPRRKGVLRRVCVLFSKAISDEEKREYGDIALSLGAEVVKVWESVVTHVVHTGKKGKTLLELDDRVKIVSPAWLIECKNMMQHVDEAKFPVELNPRRHLPTVVMSSKGTAAQRIQGTKRSRELVPLVASSTKTEPPQTPMRTKKMAKNDNNHDMDMAPVNPLSPVSVRLDFNDNHHAARPAVASSPASLPEDAEQRTMQKELVGLVGAIFNFGASESLQRHGASPAHQIDSLPTNPSSNGPPAVTTTTTSPISAVPVAQPPAPATTPQLPPQNGSKQDSDGVSRQSTPGSIGNTQGLGRSVSGAAVLKRSELKGSSAAAGASNPQDRDEEQEDEADQIAPAVTYVDRKQLRKQKMLLEASGSKQPVPSSASKRKRYLDDSSSSPPSVPVLLESGDEDVEKEDVKMESKDEDEYPRFFTLSKYDEAERAALTKSLFNMGASVDDEFKMSKTTHVIAPIPSRSLKYLLGIAAGAWVLTTEYVRACEKSGKFLAEHDYEWTTNHLPEGAVQTEEKIRLAEAPQKMRLYLASGKPPLMSNIRCVVLGNDDVISTYKQLAIAMHATVLYAGTAPTWRKYGRVTHVFVSTRYQVTQEDLKFIQSQKLECCLTEWIVQAILEAKLPKTAPFVPSNLKQ